MQKTILRSGVSGGGGRNRGVHDAFRLAQIKTLVSSRSGQTIFERIREGAAQIDRSGAAFGMVVINAKNVIDHDAFWGPPPPFARLDAAVEALRAQLRALIESRAGSASSRVG